GTNQGPIAIGSTHSADSSINLQDLCAFGPESNRVGSRPQRKGTNTTLSNILPSVLIDRSTACNLTLDPDFCNTVFPHRGFHNLCDYGRLSLAKSLSNAREMLDSVNSFLARPSVLPPNAILALQDCLLLSGLNVDFLTAVVNTSNDTDCLLDHQAQKVHAILSAILTNHQTCYDGLQVAASAWFVRNLSTVPLSVCSKNYGGALLFHEVWVGRHGELPLRMSAPKRELFERWSGRRLLQAIDSVLVHDVVVVSPDGSGNFTTIGDAVTSAPNNLSSSNGFHLIYVAAGVCQEYVVIPNHTTYLMMIGEGINQTVITGNHSVADGWTTFNSSTFAVMGEGFVTMNITFRNTAIPIKYQAVAVLNGADLSTFYGCSIEGCQDTLYAITMRQFYRDCDI
ncbi:pectinesterase, partial [Musa troglodytarum]